MAKAYRALSNIRYSEPDDEGNLVEKVLPYGSLVSGFTTEQMKELWDAGVLEELEIPNAPDAQTTKAPTSPESEGQGPAAGSTESKGAETGAAQTS